MSYEIKRASNYSILEVDLSQSHDEEEIYIPGDTLAVISIDGTLDASLDDPDAPTMEIDKITRVVTRPEKWTYLYISNAAQAGKSATLYIGREASFESVPQRTGNVGILDTTATQIDPLGRGDQPLDVSSAEVDVDINSQTLAAVETEDSVFAGVNYGEDTVAAAGTAEALNGGTALAVPAGSQLLIRALDANAGKVYVGDSAVSSADGYPLGAGQTLTLKIDDVSTVYIDVDNNGEGVRWIVEG